MFGEVWEPWEYATIWEYVTTWECVTCKYIYSWSWLIHLVFLRFWMQCGTRSLADEWKVPRRHWVQCHAPEPVDIRFFQCMTIRVILRFWMQCGTRSLANECHAWIRLIFGPMPRTWTGRCSGFPVHDNQGDFDFLRFWMQCSTCAALLTRRWMPRTGLGRYY